MHISKSARGIHRPYLEVNDDRICDFRSFMPIMSIRQINYVAAARYKSGGRQKIMRRKGVRYDDT